MDILKKCRKKTKKTTNEREQKEASSGEQLSESKPNRRQKIEKISKQQGQGLVFEMDSHGTERKARDERHPKGRGARIQLSVELEAATDVERVMPGAVVYGGRADAGGFVPSTGITYQVEHLNTYVFPKLSGENAIEQALIRFREAERTSPLSTTNCVLRLTRESVFIINADNALLIEAVPLSDVRSARAVMSHGSGEIYRNLLLFASKTPKNMIDVFIFQVHRLSAEEVLQNFRKALSSLLQESANLAAPGWRKEEVVLDEPPILPEDDGIDDAESLSPSVSPSEHGGYWPRKPLPPGGLDFEDNNNSSQVLNRFGSLAKSGGMGTMNNPVYHGGTLPSAWSAGLNTMPFSDVPSQNVKQEYLLLNYCFDDMEEFISRLRAVDVDPNETRFWTVNTRVSSLQPPPCPGGGGYSSKMLEVLPTISEFVDVIRKLKLAIMLLSRLDGRLYDPPADEVLHGLFGQLRLLTRYSFLITSSQQSASPLPATVVAPLLSRRAIEFLNHNLSPSETQFWESLGEAWTTPRDQWTRPVEPYAPIFANKKQPNPAWIETL